MNKNNILVKQLGKVRLLALDFDGVLTNGFVYVKEDGTEIVRCSRKDSKGVDLLEDVGIRTIVISEETNKVVKKRCNKMGVDCFLGVANGFEKLKVLKKYIKKKNILSECVVYVGDDVNDIPIMKYVGFPITVDNGHEQCKKLAVYITNRKGGNHAVREVSDLILKNRKK